MREMSITADGLNQQGRAESSDKLYSIHVCVILFNTFSLSTHHYNKAKCQNARRKKTLVEREVGLSSVLGIIN